MESKGQTGQFLCGDHYWTGQNDTQQDQIKFAKHQPPSARAAALKRESPPTPADTPGTAALYRGNDFGQTKRLDQSATPSASQASLHYNPEFSAGAGFPYQQNPSVHVQQQQQQQPQFVPPVVAPPVSVKPEHMGMSQSSSDMNGEFSPNTRQAAEKAAREAAAKMSFSMNYSVGTNGTASINSVDLLKHMLDTRGDSGLMIHGDLDTKEDGNSMRPRYWTPQEDEQLRKAVSQYGAKHWKTIATFVPGRTHVQCLQRWNKVLKPGLKKGQWTEEEDMTLTRLVHECGEEPPDWAKISAKIPGRSTKQCRERWCFNLDPSINKGEWTSEEDEILLAKQAEVGNKWSLIASDLPGRTENAIKTRYKSIIRAKKKEWRPSEDALLLAYQKQLGNRWEEIAEKLPNRTKNAVKMRFKFLTEEKTSNPAESSSMADSKEKTNSSGICSQNDDLKAASDRGISEATNEPFDMFEEVRRQRLQQHKLGAYQSSKKAQNTAEARTRARKTALATVQAAESALEIARRNAEENRMQMQSQMYNFGAPGMNMIAPNFVPMNYPVNAMPGLGASNSGFSSLGLAMSTGTGDSRKSSSSSKIQRDNKSSFADLVDDLEYNFSEMDTTGDAMRKGGTSGNFAPQQPYGLTPNSLPSMSSTPDGMAFQNFQSMPRPGNQAGVFVAPDNYNQMGHQFPGGVVFQRQPFPPGPKSHHYPTQPQPSHPHQPLAPNHIEGNSYGSAFDGLNLDPTIQDASRKDGSGSK